MSKNIAMQMVLFLAHAAPWTLATLPNAIHNPELCNVSQPGWFCDPDFQMPRDQADEIAGALVRRRPDGAFENIPHLALFFLKEEKSEDSVVQIPCELQEQLIKDWKDINKGGSFQVVILNQYYGSGCRGFIENVDDTILALAGIDCLSGRKACTPEQIKEASGVLRTRVKALALASSTAQRNSEERESKKRMDSVFLMLCAGALLCYQLYSYFNQAKYRSTNV